MYMYSCFHPFSLGHVTVGIGAFASARRWWEAIDLLLVSSKGSSPLFYHLYLHMPAATSSKYRNP